MGDVHQRSYVYICHLRRDGSGIVRIYDMDIYGRYSPYLLVESPCGADGPAGGGAGAGGGDGDGGGGGSTDLWS